MGPPEAQGLYDPRNEHDACGVGFVVNIKGRKSNALIRDALQILLEPRPSRGSWRRSAGWRWRGLPDSNTRPAVARLGGAERPKPAAARRLRRGDVFPAAGPQGARFCDPPLRPFRQSRRANSARLARRADRHHRSWPDRAAPDAGDPPGHRGAGARGRRIRMPSNASCFPSASKSRIRWRNWQRSTACRN